jgi:hypothetical protein
VKQYWRLPKRATIQDGDSGKAAESGLKTGKISTESLFCCQVIGRCAPRHESLALLEFAALSLRLAAGGFHSLAQFSTASAPTRKMALAISLEIHEQDTRHCQPKGRSWQNHYSDQSGRLPRT